MEAEYCIANGRSHNAEIIYGDTDSVMVRFGPTELAKVMELGTSELSLFPLQPLRLLHSGKEAAEFVTTKFVKPINLEFEKVYFPYLLISKKRYAGLYWTRPDKYDKMDAKGIEVLYLILSPYTFAQHIEDRTARQLSPGFDGHRDMFA